MSQTTQAASLASPVQDSQAASGSIAPAWHTVLMILLVLGPLIQAVAVEHSHPGVPLRSPAAIPLYLIGAVVQAIFFLFAWLGVRLRKNSLRTLVGARWSSWGQFARDIGLAMIFWVVWYAALSLLKLGLAAAGIANAGSTGIPYPNGVLEVALWIPNCILAGIVEETVFRGYLMKQFTAWFHSAALGVALQAILFGVAHAYTLGIRQVIIISASGILIGVFVRWCKSIRPAMAFHAWADIFGAVIVKGLPFQ
jgi:CAAX protease family protein